MKKILVTGATGPLGGAVMESLVKLSSAERVVALARDVSRGARFAALGVELRKGDYEDVASLTAAFRGIDQLYFVSGNDMVRRMAQHTNVVNAALAAGVRRVVYTSIPRKEGVDVSTSAIRAVVDSHVGTEELLKKSGLTYTILQHGIYADMIPVFAGPHVLDTKTIYVPAGEGRVSYAVRADQAEAGAKVLLDESGAYDNKVLPLTGLETVSFADAAAVVSQVSGVDVGYISPSAEEFRTTLSRAGVPAEAAGVAAAFATAMKEGELDVVTDDLARLLGRKPMTAAQFLSAVYGGGRDGDVHAGSVK